MGWIIVILLTIIGLPIFPKVLAMFDLTNYDADDAYDACDDYDDYDEGEG